MEIFEINLEDSFSAGPIGTTIRLLLKGQKTGGAKCPHCGRYAADHPGMCPGQQKAIEEQLKKQPEPKTK